MRQRPAEDSAEQDETLLRCRVKPREAGVALLEFLSARFRYLPREQWRVEIDAGRVTLDNRRVDPLVILRHGDVVITRRVLREPEVPTDVRVVHDRAGVVVVDKPAGLPFHGDGVFVRNTLVAFVAQLIGPGLEPLQRLDRETSGLCMFARGRDAARALRAMRVDAIEKVYLAIARGVVAEDRFEVDACIGMCADSRVALRRGVVSVGSEGARPARTAFEVVKRGPQVTLLRCRLHSGRTHQIRVHLESIGHPLFGDKLYGRSDDDYLAFVHHVKAGGDAGLADRFGAARHMLHAHRLAFESPVDGAELDLRSEPPADFAACAADLGLG